MYCNVLFVPNPLYYNYLVVYVQLKTPSDYILSLSRYCADANINSQPVIIDTNAESVETQKTRITESNSYVTPTEISIGDVNINYIGLSDKSKKFTLQGIRFKFRKCINKDGELKLSKQIFNVDRTGISIFKVIHQLMMPVYAHDPQSLLRYLMEVYTTEIRICKFCCDNVAEVRLEFIEKYFNLLKTGSINPMKAFKQLVQDNQKYKDTNVEEFFNRKKNNSRKGYKGKNTNPKKNDGKSDKNDVKVGEISNSTFSSSKN